MNESSCYCSHYEDSVESINFVLLPELSTKELQQLAVQFKIQVQKVIDLLWLFLELHMLKLMLLSIMLLCVIDVSDAASQPLVRWEHFKVTFAWRNLMRKPLYFRNR